MELVSVIMPTYKRSDMLGRAIDSILNQTYKNVEIIVVDDNNPDTDWRSITEEKMQKYIGEERVKYIKHDHNKNGAAARNTGLKAAKGEIITFLDDDDYYRPDKIEKQVNYLHANKHHHAVYCGWHRDGNDFIPNGEGDLSYGILSGFNIIITNSIMMWREDAISCGGWDEHLKRHQEAAFLLNYFRSNQTIGRIEEVLVDFDTSDRSNVSNPELNEEQIEHLLKQYEDLVNRCEIKQKGSASMIYASRDLGIVLTYAKCGKYSLALLKFINYWISHPLTFSKVVFNYTLKRTSSDYKKQTR